METLEKTIHREYNEAETEIDLSSHEYNNIGLFPSIENELGNLELGNNLQEKEIVSLMYTLHSITLQVEYLKKQINEIHKKTNLSTKASPLKESKSLNSSTLNTSIISRGNLNKSKIFETEKVKKLSISKNKYNLMSPTVSININSGCNIYLKLDKNSPRNLNEKSTLKIEKSVSIDKNNILSKNKSTSNNSYSTKHKISIAQKIDKKKESVLTTMTKFQIKNSPAPQRTITNSKSILTTKTSTFKRKIENKIRNENIININESSKNILSVFPTESDFSQRTSYKFEPKRKHVKDPHSSTNNPNITEITSLNFDCHSSFKSEDTSFHQNTQSFNSELLKYIKPRQLFSSTSNNVYFNNNVYSFISNLNYKSIYEKIFSFLGIRNKLKNITRELRNSFIEINCKKIQIIKEIKNKELEECRADKTLDLVLELEILNHKEERLRGFVKSIV